jgi:hypothetical protein
MHADHIRGMSFVDRELRKAECRAEKGRGRNQ